MTPMPSRLAAAAALTLLVLHGASAAAAPGDPPKVDPAPPPTAPAPVAPAAATAPSGASPVQPAPAAPSTPPATAAPPPAASPTPAALASPAPAAATAPDAAAASAATAADHWYDSVRFEAFVDAYGSVNYNLPQPQSNANQLRAPDVNNGFSLAWVGLDVTHEAKPVGATISLRFGPASSLFAGSDTQYGMQYVRQAFATWKPVEKLALDFGKWDGIAGAEGPDSQKNMNYTRGALYWLGQPLFHTGLRATYTVNDTLALRLIAVNGWNDTIDNNLGKTFGAQVTLTPVKQLSAAVTYITGPERSDTMTVTCPAGQGYSSGAYGCAPLATGVTYVPNQTVADSKANGQWRQFVDVLVNYNPSDALSFALNGDVGYDVALISPVTGAQRDVYWYGGMLAGRYAFNDVWGVALRGEYYRDPQGFTTGAVDAAGNPLDVTLGTGTLTIEAKPSQYLIIRLENRVDAANQPIFHKGVSGTTDTQATTLLGIVLTTGHTWNAPPPPPAGPAAK